MKCLDVCVIVHQSAKSAMRLLTFLFCSARRGPEGSRKRSWRASELHLLGFGLLPLMSFLFSSLYFSLFSAFPLRCNTHLQAGSIYCKRCLQVGDDLMHDSPVWKLAWSAFALEIAASCEAKTPLPPSVSVWKMNIEGHFGSEPACVVTGSLGLAV